MSRLQLDTVLVEREINDLLAAYPEMAEDDVLRSDAIEGNTDAHELLSRVIRAVRSETAMADATKAAAQQVADDFKRRQESAEKRADRLRSLAYRIIKVAKPNGPVRLPEATLSLANVAPKLVIEDESLIPENCFTPVIGRKLNREAITALFTNNETCPGARMSEPSDRLNVRWV